MKRHFYIFAVTILSLVISGCAGLAVMKPVERIASVTDKNMALVNFVRPNILMGDGVDFEVWDGGSFVGTLKAGTMVQYFAPAGEHTFMVNPTQGGSWAYRNINIAGGGVYYLKPNSTVVMGLQLGMADSSDKRIEIWNSKLTPMAIDKSESKNIPKENIVQANENWQRLKQLPNK
jgi:hypothetical protein